MRIVYCAPATRLGWRMWIHPKKGVNKNNETIIYSMRRMSSYVDNVRKNIAGQGRVEELASPPPTRQQVSLYSTWTGPHCGYPSQKDIMWQEGGGSLFLIIAPSTHIWYSCNWIGPRWHFIWPGKEPSLSNTHYTQPQTVFKMLRCFCHKYCARDWLCLVGSMRLKLSCCLKYGQSEI